MVGILTDEQQKFLAKLLDDKIKLNGLLEIVDGFIFNAIIVLLDDKLVEKLKNEIKKPLSELVQAIMNEQYDLVAEIAPELLNTLINIPGIDETAESVLFKGLVEMLIALIVDKAEYNINKNILKK